MGQSYYYFKTLFLFLILVQFLDSCFSLPLCTDSRAPVVSSSSLQFCSYNGTSCCDNATDLSLRRRFQSINVSDSNCAALVKSVICSRCDPFSAELFRVDSGPRQVPVLCNSTVASNSRQSNQSTTNFCSRVWNTCQNASMLNSPFTASSQTNSNSTRLTDLWQSQAAFCDAFGGASEDESVCYSGEPVSLNNTSPPSPPAGTCLEKIGNGSYLNMVAHPDGSNRAFFANQQGRIWLATIPSQGSGQVLGLDESNAFLDLTDEVHFDTEFGMLGIAFHPRFAENGRLFVSFSCDKAKWPDCAGRCACNSDVNCDPSTLSPDNGAQPCQFQSVIAEFTANGTNSQPSSATSANPSEVRRIFTMGLPYTSHHGGQILFGPEDGHLYFMMGDGGGIGDPHNFAQNKNSLLGKIMRFDIDNIPSASEVDRLGLWGNYSIPNDNPSADDTELRREIWAVGFRNPWRCSFDSQRPSYFMCADVGMDQYEEVDLVTRGGNYGWRAYEGTSPYVPPSSTSGNTSLRSIRPIFPVMGYNHSDVNINEGSASITGGYVYRSMTDPCMFGRYIFADLYAGAIWAGAENPINSGNFTSNRIPFNCARDSPLNCTSTPGSSIPALSYIFSFGEDNNRDVYLLTNSGVYRVVRPSRCNYMCATENATTTATPGPASSPASGASLLRCRFESLLVLISFVVFFACFS